MKLANQLSSAALAAALSGGGALAQVAADTAAPIPVPGTAPVVTDVAPPPPEDRSSSGAVVLENSMVRAQRDKAFEHSAARTGVASVGRGVLRTMMRERTRAELAQAKRDEARELRGRGAASLVKQ